ncbi:MAG: ornithine cyclodeaminase family protein [Terriglobia bacterium]
MLLLTESDVLAIFSMETALEAVEASFKAQAEGGAVNHPRQRIFLPGVSLDYMAAALPSEHLLGMKIYTVSRSALRFIVLLYESERGELLALIEADQMGRIRTGAASGVATKFLSREDSASVGVIGSGRQARTQLHAISLVRRLRSARVFSRDKSRREQFSKEMSQQLNLEVEPAESAEAAARFGDVLITATNAQEPVVHAEWLKPGVHINAIGANVPSRRELDDATLGRASVIAVDSAAQCRIEAGDLIQGFAREPGGWQSVAEMWEIIAGRKPGRKSSEDITIFKSTGMALWDVAAAGVVYRRARELGRGKEVHISDVLP